MQKTSSIGVFDSGYGGLTVFKEIAGRLPEYNYIYLGDNARSPYGDHSFETVYAYTWQCVRWLFEQGCQLVILACNTASAKALRTIQQVNLPAEFPYHKVLGVIRPTAESIGNYSSSKNIGILGTRGTVESKSYPIEIGHFFPDTDVFQQACPMWVPIIENNEQESDGADFFVKKYLEELLTQHVSIDVILLACTHYPLLFKKIREFTPAEIEIVQQSEIVAEKLADYLSRHPELNSQLRRASECHFFTTRDPQQFDTVGSKFFGKEIHSRRVSVS